MSLCEFLKFVLVIAILPSSIRCDVDLPSFIHVCHKDDPALNQCFMAAIEDLRPFLVTGVPEYKIPSLEPLFMTDLIREEAAGMKIETSNVSAYGCSEFFVRSIKVDTETQVFQFDIDIPKLRIEAHYTVDGKLLLLPIRGNGNLEANVTDIISKCKLYGELFEKDGETYLKFTSIDLKVKITGGGHVMLENMFNGDKILLGVINDALNKNLDAFLRELMPVIEKNLASTFMEIANDIVESFTYKQLFPH